MPAPTPRTPARAGPPRRRTAPRGRGARTAGPATYLAILAFVIGYLLIDLAWSLPLWVAGLYAGVSILCFVVYAVDKSAARAGRRRVPERTLLWLGFAGGWPGAILAQQALRHKTQKASFRSAFWLSVVANIVVFVLFATPLLTEFAHWTTRPFLR